MLRYLILSTHYRRPINFTDDVIDSTRKGLASFARLFDRAARVGAAVDDAQPDVDQASRTLIDTAAGDFVRVLLNLKMKWLEAMDDDFNTSSAIATMHELAAATNAYIDTEKLESTKTEHGPAAVAAAVATIKKLGKTLGLFQKLAAPAAAGVDDFAPKLMDLVIHLRKELRAAKNFALADDLRNKLTAIGVTLEDRPDGTIWRKA